MFKIKQLFIKKIDKLSLEGYTWELINSSHTNYIIKWRNEPSNLIYFNNQEKLTSEDQERFIKEYSHLDRIDIVLIHERKPIGVFNIKNMESIPEYGALLGEKCLRGRGIGFSAKMAIFDYWFNILNQESIYVINKRINKKIITSNLQLGFKVDEENDEFLKLKLTKESFIKMK